MHNSTYFLLSQPGRATSQTQKVPERNTRMTDRVDRPGTLPMIETTATAGVGHSQAALLKVFL